MSQTPYAQGLPSSTPLLLPGGNINPQWLLFFLALWNRTGGATGSPTLILDGVSNTAGSMLVRYNTTWQGLNPGTQYQILQMGVEFPEWGQLPAQAFGDQFATTFLAAPAAAQGLPSFRTIATKDLAPLGGQYPGTTTNDAAAAGNIGEYVSSQVPASGAVALSTGVAADITSISLTAGDWDVWGSVASDPAGTTTQSDLRGWISATSATDPGTPNEGAYVELQTTIAAGLSQTLGIMPTRLSLAATTTIYLSTKMAFAVSTLAAFGFIGARRAR